MSNSVNSHNCGLVNVTSAAYVTLVASTPINFNQIIATDTTGKILKLAVGAAGHEIDLFQLPVDDTDILTIPNMNSVPVGSRLSIRAIGTTANSGYSVVTLVA